MKPPVKLIASLVVSFCAAVTSAGLAFAQDHATSTTAMPSAYVYVATVTASRANNTAQLYGYSADANGILTVLAGSPFWTQSTGYSPSVAHTASWLFVSDGISIYSFSIASNGSLKEVSSVNTEQYTGTTASVVFLFLDRTGSTLYAQLQDGSAGSSILFFHKNGTTGTLTYFGTVSTDSAELEQPFSLIGDNDYGYAVSCVQQSAEFYAARRNSDGSLTPFTIEPTVPDYPNDKYCAFGQAADRANNLAVGFVTEQSQLTQLGVYTADSSGNLTTNSTYQNMPDSAVGDPAQLQISPAGTLLAVGGTNGLQVFHFNGGNPITQYTPLLTDDEIWGLTWDTHSHLYGIGPSNQLYAFTITTTEYHQVSGSPYVLSVEPTSITVLSK